MVHIKLLTNVRYQLTCFSNVCLVRFLLDRCLLINRKKLPPRNKKLKRNDVGTIGCWNTCFKVRISGIFFVYIRKRGVRGEKDMYKEKEKDIQERNEQEKRAQKKKVMLFKEYVCACVSSARRS